MYRGRGRSSSSRKPGHEETKSRKEKGSSSTGRGQGRGLIDLGKIMKAPEDPKPKDPMDQTRSSESQGSGSDPLTYKDIMGEQEYHQSPITEDILPIEQEDLIWINDPWYLMKKYLDTKGYPAREYKCRPYYVTILEQTGSVEIKSFPQNNSTDVIAYSKCAILKVLNLIDWGMDASKPRVLKNPKGVQYTYNYWDYIDAWKNAFYYENPRKKHSWFFQIDRTFLRESRVIPVWWYQWWTVFGPQLSFLPEIILGQTYENWCNNHPVLKQISEYTEGQCTLYYFAEFSIPWIWKWGLKIEKNPQGFHLLKRTMFFRWWAQWPIHKTLEEIVLATRKYAEETSQKSSNKYDLKSIREQLQRQFPHLTPDELMIKCLEQIKEQMEDAFADTTSTQDNMSSEDIQETQDPNDCNMADYWDAMIKTAQIMAEKNKKGKEKI